MNSRIEARWSKFKSFELKTGRYGASDQRPVPRRFRGLPSAGRHNSLGLLAAKDVRAKRDTNALPTVIDVKPYGSTGMKVPNLGRVDAVPMRTLTPGEQE